MPRQKKESDQIEFENINTTQDFMAKVENDANLKPNGFKQLSENEMARLRMLTRINPIAAQIFLFLMEHMGRNNAVACSQTLLAQITDRSRTTVHRAIVVLKEHQFVDVKKMGATQVFHLDTRITWRSYENKINYAELTAPILLDFDENPQMKQYFGHPGSVGILMMEDTDA